jgi:hypothetical protein
MGLFRRQQLRNTQSLNDISAAATKDLLAYQLLHTRIKSVAVWRFGLVFCA